jgi:hypothetical protein
MVSLYNVVTKKYIIDSSDIEKQGPFLNVLLP